MAKRVVPHFTRWQYACDAVPEIKTVDASPAALATGKAVIDAQEAGVAPRNIGVDVDKDASVDEIVLRLFPGVSPEDAETIVSLFEKYKAAPATVEVADGDDEPAGTMPAPEVTDSAAPVEEKKAEEPKPVEVQPESEDDGETYSRAEVDEMLAAQKKELMAMIEAAKTKATDEAKEHYEGLSKAAQDCAPLIKIADPMSFKSSADIYRKALKLRGFAADSVPDKALPAMVDFVKKNGNGVSARPVIAADSAPTMSGDDAILSTLESRIKVL